MFEEDGRHAHRHLEVDDVIVPRKNGVNLGFGVRRFLHSASVKILRIHFSWTNRELVDEARQHRDWKESRWSNINPRPTKSDNCRLGIQADNHKPKRRSKCLADLKNQTEMIAGNPEKSAYPQLHSDSHTPIASRDAAREEKARSADDAGG